MAGLRGGGRVVSAKRKSQLSLLLVILQCESVVQLVRVHNGIQILNWLAPKQTLP